MTDRFKKYLLATTIICGVTAGMASPVYAQDTGQAAAATEEDDEAIVITGSLFRRTNTETASPVTTLTTESLAERGITTAADAIRSISADNSGSIPTSFTNGFGSGGAGVSLRGLTVNATLTVVDGLRTAFYPLADDGQRSFVDLNTLPMIALDRIEVLKDGASSTYGADAIGGVVNLIMKKNFKGVNANLEWGTSDHGGGDSLRASALVGFGDYDANGTNIYFGFEYEKHQEILASQRGYPYNTNDLSAANGSNLNWHTLDNLSSTNLTVVRPATMSNPTNLLSGTAVAFGSGGQFVVIGNPADCTATADGVLVTTVARGSGCSANPAKEYGRIQPETRRWGVVARAAVRLSDTMEGYLMGSLNRSEVWSEFLPLTVRSANPVRTTGLVLPVFLADGSLNPNNPFASASGGQAALLYHRFSEVPNTFHQLNDVIRAAAGVSGSFGDGWTYTVDMSASNSKLHQEGKAIHLASLLTAISTGSYNFRNRNDAGNAAALAQIVRPVVTEGTSSEYVAQAVVTKELTQLAGGPLLLGVGGQVRYESQYKPNANAAQAFLGVNQYSTVGSHTVSAGFFEISAPVLETLELGVSGRYDSYSEGFNAFSPKFTAKFTPIKEIALRATYSKGFRAPSFGETGADSGVIGFTAAVIPCSAKIQHGATGTSASCTGGNAYVNNQAVGFNSVGNPNLKPERSRSYTLGLVAQPVPWFSFTADYYNIKMKNLISGGPFASQAINAYYAGTALPAGYTVTLNPIDPEYPAGIQTLFSVNSPYANAAFQKTDGLDMSATVRANLTDNVKLTSTLEATVIFNFDFNPGGGSPTYHYVGTQAPYILSSGAGTPKWRGNWMNTLDFGRASLTAVVSYVEGIKSVAEDQNGPGATDCATSTLYGHPEYCYIDDFVSVDLTGSYDVTDNISLYFNIYNLFDAKAPTDAANYAGNTGGLNYSPTWAQAGAVGRFFKIGAKAKF